MCPKVTYGTSYWFAAPECAVKGLCFLNFCRVAYFEISLPEVRVFSGNNI